MATYTVTTLNDVVDDTDGEISLREALVLAAGNAGADTVTFSSPGTIALALGELVITQAGGPVTIDGDLDDDGSPDITLDAQGASRVLRIEGVAGDPAVVALEGLVIVGGNAEFDVGGGLRADRSTVTLTNSAVSSNSAYYGGGLHASGSTVTLNNSTVSGNSADVGGGLYAGSSTVALTNSTVSGNSANYGGGLGAYLSTVTLTNSTVSSNSADDYGGGLDVGSSTVALTNSTVSGNSAEFGGGLYARSSIVTLTNSTVSGNSAVASGALYSLYSVSVKR